MNFIAQFKAQRELQAKVKNEIEETYCKSCQKPTIFDKLDDGT